MNILFDAGWPSTVMVVILLELSSTMSQQSDDCPDGWFEHNGQCYHFYIHSDKNVQEATIYCGQLFSGLVSINNQGEHAFIQNWLDIHDVARQKWFTSGIRDNSGALLWDSSGEGITTDFFPDSQIRDQKLKDPVTGLQINVIVYTFSESLNHYMWSWGQQLVNGPFICELSKSDTWLLYQSQRDYSYGNLDEHPSSWEIGPSITLLSGDTIFYEFGDTITTIVLECQATGNPAPTYRWFRKQNTL
ncbi:contactin-3 [Biomphalaria pfeifferi]|uniref:Contactin-3 n=1 Tax=Biomphalaria pfeifferi TaxID=112525 RepID=A0AAD8F4Q8_BIOPF|nr:contactin-3 [Biomphalaria pfeifferi]